MSSGRPINLAGQRFGRLLVVRRAPNTAAGKTQWYCHCDCGNGQRVIGASLRTGKQKSCGCWMVDCTIERSTTHGQAGRNKHSGAYGSWADMVKRCTNPKNWAWKYYGARGVKVCDEWLTFENFYRDMGDRPPKLTIDRINNDGNYEPGNCQWADRLTQARNRRPMGSVSVPDSGGGVSVGT